MPRERQICRNTGDRLIAGLVQDEDQIAGPARIARTLDYQVHPDQRIVDGIRDETLPRVQLLMDARHPVSFSKKIDPITVRWVELYSL